MKEAYRTMGLSILSGAITTFGSGFFLVFATFSYFYKFAMTVTVTISFSYFTAVLTFGAISHVIGPENDLGDPFAKCKKKKND